MTAIAVDHWCNTYKTDTKQAFFYGDLEDDELIYITPPGWQICGSSRGISYNYSRQSMKLFRLLANGIQRSQLGWRKMYAVR